LEEAMTALTMDVRELSVDEIGHVSGGDRGDAAVAGSIFGAGLGGAAARGAVQGASWGARLGVFGGPVGAVVGGVAGAAVGYYAATRIYDAATN
jgi:hypothetical protein